MYAAALMKIMNFDAPDSTGERSTQAGVVRSRRLATP